MSFRETIFATTDIFGWVIIVLVVVALVVVMISYFGQARAIVRAEGWPALWQHIRRHVLTRKPRNRR
jgi:hypothetical protein